MSTNTEPKKPIQPFVPVMPEERTELYTHKELRALASTDPRNELDEMSEPQRFRKDLEKPATVPLASPHSGYRGGLILGLLAGASIGALLMALTAPRTVRG